MDRFSHMYIVGKTGTGKTTLIETLVRQDIAANRGCALIDPHGDLAERVAATSKDLRRDVIYLNAPDPRQPHAYNPLSRVGRDKRALVASGLLEVLKKMWTDAWGVRMEHILRNALLTLLDQPAATMADIHPLLSDEAFRARAIRNIENAQVRRFWAMEYDTYSRSYQADGVAPILNKVGAFLADPRLHRILARHDGALRLRAIMDQRQVLLVNLAKGEIGEDSAGLLGGLLMTSLGLAAFSRTELPEHEWRAFFLFVDEFQEFTTLSIANMLSELRKYRVGAVLANQYLHQLEGPIRHSVLGNAVTLIAFRVGATDAAFLTREFEPVFDRLDLVSLPNHDICLKLMIDGTPSKPFSATTVKHEELQAARPGSR
jgi:type IV secretory pathway TraG/TraD family ATPase VirD4